jgi:hypothetical protein
MHKSGVFTFGFLISSLIMLAIMPFLNQQNGFSNTAMAQGYEGYNYGDNNSYSTYPTDDKKYEYRTGPFEGFFVSSVEFCKNVKFGDDRKDHTRDNNDIGDGNGVGDVLCILESWEVALNNILTNSD